MLASQVLKRMFIPAAVLINNQKDCHTTNTVCRANDLPIYCPEGETEQSQDDLCDGPSTLEKIISTFRKSATDKIDVVKHYEKQCGDVYYDGKKQAQQYIDFLQEENNTTPKYGAIAVGGLSGVILGMRGGWFKRTIYGTAGIVIMAAVCYPKEAREYSREMIKNGQEYTTIAYNFINGSEGDGVLTSAANYFITFKQTIGFGSNKDCEERQEKVRQKMHHVIISPDEDDCTCPGIVVDCPNHPDPESITKSEEVSTVEDAPENISAVNETEVETKNLTEETPVKHTDTCEEECPKHDIQLTNCAPVSNDLDIEKKPHIEMANISVKRTKKLSNSSNECYSVCPGQKLNEEKTTGKTEPVIVRKKKCKNKKVHEDNDDCFSIC